MSAPNQHALLVIDGYYLSQANWRQKRDGHGELGMAELVSFLEQRHGVTFYEKFYLDSTPDAPTPHHTATLNKLRHLGFDQSDDYKYKAQTVVSPSGERFTITVAAGVDVGIGGGSDATVRAAVCHSRGQRARNYWCSSG